MAFSGGRGGDKHKQSTYFAVDEAEKVASHMGNKSFYWYNTVYDNRYLDLIRRSWYMYHGFFYDESHVLGYGGESGELVNLAVNHYRNIAQHMLTMTTSTRPSFQPKSTNTDYESQVQTTLAHGLLDYYMKEKRLEKYLKKAVEYAIVLSAGYIKMDWNATSGEIYDYVEPELEIDEETGEERPVIDPVTGKPSEGYPVFEGDIEFTNLSPFDVVFDSTKEDVKQNDWVLIRTFKNRFDLAAKYPELADKILQLPTKDELGAYRLTFNPLDQTDDIPVYEFYHKRTESVPNGRFITYLSDDVILTDTSMPYRDLPIYRISPSDVLGAPYGYTSMFDLLPLQESVNALYSTIMTNQNAFGVQNILNPRGNDVRLNHVGSGMNFIEYNAEFGRPEALNLTQTPGEIFNFLQMLEQAMETVSGVNSVVRGNPEASLKSGNALALVQSQSLQFISGLQQSYIMLIEDVGTGLINVLKDFAKVPRIAEIVGISNRTKMKEFTGDDLNSISRVVVDVGNALAQCLGKDTHVMMSNGSTKVVQDIKVGDKVLGPDSNYRTVGNVNSGKEEMFKVTSKDKKRDVYYECNKSHILTLKYCSDDVRYGAKKGDIIDISVHDYLLLPKRHKRLLQGFTVGVEFESKPVSIDPYILGSWLGDGTSACTSITTMDDEIKDYWVDYANTMGLSIRAVETKNKSKTYFVTSGIKNGPSDRNSLMNNFREYNLINNKHIPNDFLINSSEVRLEILAGLLDTDGSLSGGTFVFSQKSEKLTDQVVYLAKSLGFKVTKTLVERTFNGKEANIFRVNIGGNTHIIPTKLPRKQAKEVKKQKDWRNYGINVESLGNGTYYGFTLIEEPHFLLGDFTVTHNTTAGRTQMADNLIQMGLITSPEDYLSVMNTGKLETMTEGQINQNLLIRAENESLMDGESDVIATAVDKHSLHIREHMNVLADPDLRLDNELSARVLAHIQEHIDLLRTTDPNLLAMIGEQPLAPVGGNPIGPQGQDMGPGGVDPMLQNQQAQSTDPMLSAGVSQPTPAATEGQPNTPEDVFAKNLG